MPFGFYVTNGTGNILEQCESDHNGYGFNLDKQINMQVINCDAHHNQDPYSPSAYDGSDGFGLNGGQPANTSITFTGCRAWWNCDDGWDLFRNDGLITFNNCWAFWNGYIPGTFTEVGNGDGFKVGPTDNTDLSTQVKRILNRCVAFQNKFQGFDQNDGKVISQLYNCTSYGNGGIGFHFSYQSSLNIKHILKNNVSFQDKSAISSTPSWVQSNNTWNGTAATTSSFASLTNTGVDGPRQADGSLPNLQFLHLSAGSNLIDKGISLVSILFNGSAPDLGAYEYGGGTSSAVNQPPVANAGSDLNITLPTSAVTLNGIGTDADGSIATYQWTKIAGPSQYTIASPAAAKTVLSNLAQGVYQFELQVTDNSGASDKDTVQVTVNAGANQLPVANAGNNQTITLPTNSVTLNGNNSKDPDGSISSYAWSKVSGPSQGSITNAGSVSTTATNLVQGTYIFKLTVTDNSNATGSDSVIISVNGVFNQPPVANAGANKTITLPANSATLDGSASSDPDGVISSYAWTKSSGPAQGTITSAASATTNVTSLVQGTYVFKLTVKDNGNATASDSVIIIVNATDNQAPVANAGPNQVITLPANSVTLNGSASSDADGSIVSYTWAKTAGGTATISNSNKSIATVSNLQAGQYTFELTVTDNRGASSRKTVRVTVVNSTDQNPVADAGTSQVITLPVNSSTLNGSGSLDPDGTISTYTWSKISGPAQGSIASANQSIATANNLVQGVYKFKLTITDNNGNTASDSVTVTVNAATNQAPVADAGINQTLPFGTSSVTLDGSKSNDPDGTIAGYRWILVSGASATISDSSISKPVVSNLQGGQYIFELTVTDDKGATSTAQVKIIVNLISNQPPIADAGANQVVALPVNSVKLDGTQSADPDGTIAIFSWTKIGGPSAVTITNVSTATPIVSGLVEGQYTFELTVTDNRGASTKAQVKVTVLKALPNEAPVADAGPDQTIVLPNSNTKSTGSVRLDGSGSYDPDGTIVSYSWMKIDGASAVTINNVNTNAPTVSGLQAGQYTFEITVTDNVGAVGKDMVTIFVQPASAQGPVADAGSDKMIEFPESTTVLDGSGSHDNVGSLSYSWEQMKGPGVLALSATSASKITVKDLAIGEYIFKLTVTNSQGVKASDEVKVTVVDGTKGFAQMDLFPNPASDVINAKISSDSIGVVVLNIYDLNGKAVKKMELSKQLVDNLRQQVQRRDVNNVQPNTTLSYFTLPVNIASLAKGVYILETIIDKRTRVTSKFVKY
jgi:hypothetical protein